MSNRPSTTRRLALVAAASLLFAACGGSDGGDDAAADTTATTAAETTTTTAAPTTTEAETTTTEEATTTTAAAVEDVALSPELEAFCGLRAQAEALPDPDVFDPEAFEAWFDENLELVRQGVEVAPAEVADDMASFYDTTVEFRDFLAGYGFDLFSIPEDELDAASAGTDAASDRVSEFSDANCPESEFSEDEILDGDAIDIEADELEAILATEAGRQAVIDGFVQQTGLTEAQGECFFNELPSEELAALAGQDLAGAPSLFEALAACDISLDALVPG